MNFSKIYDSIIIATNQTQSWTPLYFKFLQEILCPKYSICGWPNISYVINVSKLLAPKFHIQNSKEQQQEEGCLTQLALATLLLSGCRCSRPIGATSTISELLHPLLEELWIISTLLILLPVRIKPPFLHSINGGLCRCCHDILVWLSDGWRVAFKEREMTEELVLAGEGGPAGAAPLCLLTAVAEMAAEVGQDREALLAATALAGVELGAVAAAEVVPRAHRRLERAEAAVRAVPVAAREGAGEAHVAAGGRPRRLAVAVARAGQCVKGLEAVAVGAHVHPEVGVAAEALAADLAEVDVLR